jgi:hypothetical protein
VGLKSSSKDSTLDFILGFRSKASIKIVFKVTNLLGAAARDYDRITYKT